MMKRSFFFLVLLGALAIVVACSSHRSKKLDEDTVTNDEAGDTILSDEDETFDDTIEDDGEPVEDTDTAPGKDDAPPVGDDFVTPDNEDVDIVPDEDTPPITNPISVPYFCQYKNGQYPAETSGNTSLAMLLYFYGWVGTPDDLTDAWGKDKANDPDGLAEIFNSYSGTTGTTLTTHADGTFDEIKALIDQGKPVIAHTWFTAAGHIVIMNGYGENGYFVNDPAGVWDLTYKGDFSLTCDHAVVGKSEFYPTSPFEAAVGPDGSIRYHEPVAE